jgi:NADH-quinone oxidoreductase subunit E
MEFSDATRQDALAIVARYPNGRSRSALLPMLHLVQSEEGYVSQSGIAFCADVLGLTKAEVGAVATFYTMYKRRPVGEHMVSVCTNTLCALLGGDEIYAAVKSELGVGHNETTADGTVTLEHAECLAACDYAPVVTVDYEFYDQQTVPSTLELVRGLQAGEKPNPTRGARLSSFRATERLLAGFPDPREGVTDDGLPGAPSLVGLQHAQTSDSEND